MTRSTLTAVAIAASVSAPAYADTYQVDKQHTEAAFQVRHLFTKVRGVFRDVDGTIRFDKANPANSNVVFRLKVASIDTGVDQRDNHLRSQDFFWAEKYPEISFTSSRVVAKGDNAFDVTGDLTIRGVTRQVTLPVTLPRRAEGPVGQREGRLRNRHQPEPDRLRSHLESGARGGRRPRRRPGQHHDRLEANKDAPKGTN